MGVRVNIYDIAKLAGVSIATVSRVVNDSPNVNDKTKEKVRKVMEENHYMPNEFARGLGRSFVKAVGLVCPAISDDYMAKAVACLEKRLREHGYDCILHCSGYDKEDKRQAVGMILKKRIDALMLIGSNFAGGKEEDTSYICEAARQIPVFMINGYVEGENIYGILADDYQAVYDATEELIFAGKRRILFLSNSDSFSAMQKRKGYEDAHKNHGLPILEELNICVENTINGTKDQLLLRRDLAFDGVIATEDGLAVGALKYAKATGISVPEEISVVGYNNSELSISCEPELTTVDARGEILCKTAVDSMMTLLEGKRINSKTIIKCHLVKRHTTDF
ncbi:LacI family DNA-binding transcriptional regulator [Parablautia intestinalis]|uniref:LacI family DNA-binding transcriptional regulator n=1 Tax=Parablautia intestinalis TaxID=2320100 RepID=UPI00241266E1|nr:LacI family DNA-binding transcriptional regulator [Parablautia intestinalis]